jgi:hypothetical protein
MGFKNNESSTLDDFSMIEINEPQTMKHKFANST